MNTRWRLAVLTGLASLSLAAAAQTAEDYLRHRWYHVEVVLFEQIDPDDDGAATAAVVEAVRYPRLPIPLAEHAPTDAALGFGAPLATEDEVPLVISNLAPPIWYAGECAAEFWQPAGDDPDDPCLPRRVDLEAYFSDDPFAGWADASEPVQEILEPAPDPRQAALEALEAAALE